jgi:hypothetical protein
MMVLRYDNVRNPHSACAPVRVTNRSHFLSVRHFVYKLLFHVHLPRFGDILILINRSKTHRTIRCKVFNVWKQIKISLSEYFNFLFAYLVITYYSLQFLSNGDTK